MTHTPLDQLPLEVLLAMQEAMADPSLKGQERARLRAKDAGFHIHCDRNIAEREARKPIPMAEAPEGVESLVLRFDRP